MSKVIITSDENQIHVDFGEYAKGSDGVVSYRRESINKVSISKDENYVRVSTDTREYFDISYNEESSVMCVEKVNEIIPASNVHLRDLINQIVK